MTKFLSTTWWRCLRHERSIAYDERGSSLIETALVLPLFALLLVLAIDCGRAYSYSITLRSAAEAGAMYGLYAPHDTAGMLLVATSDSIGAPLMVTQATFGCECADGSGASSLCTAAPNCSTNVLNYVQVDTHMTYVPLLKYPGIPRSLMLTGHARLRVAQ